jgi:hypothetical protein
MNARVKEKYLIS